MDPKIEHMLHIVRTVRIFSELEAEIKTYFRGIASFPRNMVPVIALGGIRNKKPSSKKFFEKIKHLPNEQQMGKVVASDRLKLALGDWIDLYGEYIELKAAVPQRAALKDKYLRKSRGLVNLRNTLIHSGSSSISNRDIRDLYDNVLEFVDSAIFLNEGIDLGKTIELTNGITHQSMKDKSLKELQASLSLFGHQEKVPHNLEKSKGDDAWKIIGRDVLGMVKRFQERMTDSRFPGLLIWGKGGFGKTALARAMLRHFAKDDGSHGIEAIIYCSVKQESLENGQLVRNEDSATSVVELMDRVRAELNEVLGHSDTDANIDTILDFSDRRVLLCLDNIDTIIKSGEQYEKLHNLIPQKWRVLATSRFNTGILFDEPLGNLDATSMRELTRNHLSAPYRDDEMMIKCVLENSDGCPLAARHICEVVARTGRPITDAARTGRSDVLKFSFTNLISSLRGSDEHRVLASIYAATKDLNKSRLVSSEELEQLVDLPPDEIYVAIQKLKQLDLVVESLEMHEDENVTFYAPDGMFRSYVKDGFNNDDKQFIRIQNEVRSRSRDAGQRYAEFPLQMENPYGKWFVVASHGARRREVIHKFYETKRDANTPKFKFRRRWLFEQYEVMIKEEIERNRESSVAEAIFDLQYCLGCVYLELERFEEAGSVFKEIYDSCPKHRWGALRLAKALLRAHVDESGRIADAIHELDIPNVPENEEFMYRLAKVKSMQLLYSGNVEQLLKFTANWEHSPRAKRSALAIGRVKALLRKTEPLLREIKSGKCTPKHQLIQLEDHLIEATETLFRAFNISNAKSSLPNEIDAFFERVTPDINGVMFPDWNCERLISCFRKNLGVLSSMRGVLKSKQLDFFRALRIIRPGPVAFEMSNVDVEDFDVEAKVIFVRRDEDGLLAEDENQNEYALWNCVMARLGRTLNIGDEVSVRAFGRHSGSDYLITSLS